MIKGVCNSCGISLINREDVRFSCPACGKALIGRCYRCRGKSASYVCPECGFRGP